ncbi:bifunctional 3'-5' exonuclease/DNA polymerase [Microbacteriaceae bacterium 4G12]
MFALLSRVPDGACLDLLGDDGAALSNAHVVAHAELPGVVRELEARQRPRWVWDDTAGWYPPLLAAGVRVDRSHDLRLCHAILRQSELTAESRLAAAPPGPWDDAAEPSAAADDGLALFAAPDALGSEDRARPEEMRAEFSAQLAAVAGTEQPGRIRLLLAAESAGALIAAEMTHDGLPWSAEVHDRVLTELLGPRPRFGERPRKLEQLAETVRSALGAPELNPDSPADVLRALRRVGLTVTSTRKWELKELDHAAIEPLLEYKQLSRLLQANGWAWMDTWIHDGRFRPEYVPGGVVTGRWATRGGGALQLPRQVRGAVVPDPGWTLVVADAAQLEPRVLAALSGDLALAEAGRGTDIYQGLVDRGVVDSRAHAKSAMLGAMYGATQGEAGRLMPRLARAYPRAVGLVEDAARAGERGLKVTTRLGRSSPRPGEAWLATQGRAAAEDSAPADALRARGQAREWGRFTRNFVVQGSAAEWALCWMAGLRGRLAAMADGERRPHLVFFLHDEVMVHAPVDQAEEVRRAVLDAAAEAGRLLFGSFPIEFAVTTAIVDSYADAK